MPDQKTIVQGQPFVVNKNLGSAVPVTHEGLTRTNADGRSVVLPTQKQKYDFDRNGWLLIPGVLSENEIDQMRAFCQRMVREPQGIAEPERCGLGGPLQKLADHPVVVGLLNEFLAFHHLASEDCYGFRLETSLLIHCSAREKAHAQFKPRNGNGLFRPPWDSHYYRCIPGRAWSGLTRVVWELNPVAYNAGGTKFISGSHKAAYPAPDSIDDPDAPLWVTYECPAGSLIIFTESITHSDATWSNEQVERLAVSNAYNTVSNRWHSWLPHRDLLASMPPKRQTLFREPYVRRNVVDGAEYFYRQDSPYADGSATTEDALRPS